HQSGTVCFLDKDLDCADSVPAEPGNFLGLPFAVGQNPHLATLFGGRKLLQRGFDLGAGLNLKQSIDAVQLRLDSLQNRVCVRPEHDHFTSGSDCSSASTGADSIWGISMPTPAREQIRRHCPEGSLSTIPICVHLPHLDSTVVLPTPSAPAIPPVVASPVVIS